MALVLNSLETPKLSEDLHIGSFCPLPPCSLELLSGRIPDLFNLIYVWIDRTKINRTILTSSGSKPDLYMALQVLPLGKIPYYVLIKVHKVQNLTFLIIANIALSRAFVIMDWNLQLHLGIFCLQGVTHLLFILS